MIGHTADQTHVDCEKQAQGGRAMDLIDSDRGWQAREQGYAVQLTKMTPESCTPKNNVLIGIYQGKNNTNSN